MSDTLNWEEGHASPVDDFYCQDIIPTYSSYVMAQTQDSCCDEALEKENARRAGVKYVRKTKKEREEEDAENERIFNARLEKDTAAQKRTEDRMKEIDKKLQAKYDLSSMDDLDKY